jgi:hypothetical protein
MIRSPPATTSARSSAASRRPPARDGSRSGRRRGVSAAAVAYLADQRLSRRCPTIICTCSSTARCARSTARRRPALAAAHLPGVDVPSSIPTSGPGPSAPRLAAFRFAPRRPPAPSPPKAASSGRSISAACARNRRLARITLMPGLRTLLEQLAPAWDDSSGAGLLGLRGLYAAASPPTPRRRKPRPIRLSPARRPRPPRLCLRVLAHLQHARGWTRTPTSCTWISLPDPRVRAVDPVRAWGPSPPRPCGGGESFRHFPETAIWPRSPAPHAP